MLRKLPYSDQTQISSGNPNVYFKITLWCVFYTDLEIVQFDYAIVLRLKKFCTKASKLDSLQTRA